jgi:hypothetical protein
VAAHPVNALVVVQVMDNDIVCPATRSDYDAFQATLDQALATIDPALPTSRIFVVSQYGSATTQWKVLTPAQRRQEGGTGPCAFLNPDGQLVPRELTHLDAIIHGYEARLKAACQHFARCRHDDGAFGNAATRRPRPTTSLRST